MLKLIQRGVHFFLKAHDVSVVDYPKNTRMILGSLLGAIAAILQSAGLIGGIGYAFSMMATGPIVLATIISAQFGLLTYVVTAILLLIIQPSEVLVFLFTTGLLGVALGLGFRWAKRKVSVTLAGGLALTVGILLLLFMFHFPILGPSLSSDRNVITILAIAGFSLLYSWIWMRLSLAGIRQLNKRVIRIHKDSSGGFS
ncbi:hypothetical protein QE429_000746 [Bacillus sp. SORGH_AS 510]|uniref:hypothetical protein n=1 Tax=Bacillus sp. SORGH_AS_0510 TaxID=3041771 RepID=UPI0027828D68|nr:hypothetical protein [Bacillus sp. SORGH_AS_0510]MDQ1143919.1 hypothetical protein [Bacillus sp. SORGH_AS_0510]